MQFAAPLVPGRLVQRYKRFLADIDTDEGRVTVHCPNPGAMLGLNTPGARVLLSRSTNPARKLPLTWELVEADLPGLQWVGINTLRPNALVAEAFRAGAITALAGHDTLKPEVRYAEASRVDFLASGAVAGPCHVEVKNCHMMRRAGLAEFPDCKAARSARHMRDLAQVVAEGPGAGGHRRADEGRGVRRCPGHRPHLRPGVPGGASGGCGGPGLPMRRRAGGRRPRRGDSGGHAALTVLRSNIRFSRERAISR